MAKILLGAVAVAVGAVVVTQFPDIRRYLRIRSM
jgi:hypothetical protein